MGWLHTGDANLVDATRLERFVQHYQVELPLTSVPVLPHHGSRHSYGSALAEFDGLVQTMATRPLFVAAAQPERRYGHPHAVVSARCHEYGTLHIVDRRPASILQESICVHRAPHHGYLLDELI